MIVVGIPWQHEHVPTRFMCDFLRSDLKQDTMIVFGQHGDSDANRNQIVRRGLETDATHILFLDVDQGIPATVRATLAAHDKDIVSGLARHGSGSHWLAYTEVGGKYRPLPQPKGLTQVDGIGFGCVLVKMDVFRSLPAPWFSNQYSDDGEKLLENDFYFCRKAQAAGYTIWLDAGCIAPHYRMKTA